MRPFGGAFFGNLETSWTKQTHDNYYTSVLSCNICNRTFAYMADVTNLYPNCTCTTIHPGIFCRWGIGQWYCITMETVNKPHRGLLSGFLQSGYNLGFVIASIVYQIVLSHYPGNSFLEMGWRIMFFTGIIPGLVATFVRFKMSESATWLQKSREHKIERAPLKKIFATEKRKFFLALIIMTGLMFSYYTSIGFLPTFLQKYVNLDKPEVATLDDCGNSDITSWANICWIYQSIYWKKKNHDDNNVLWQL